MVWNPFCQDGEMPPTICGSDVTLSKVTIPTECDYERNCIPLFKRLEDQEWDVVISFLDTGFWPYHFVKDPLSPQEQVRTWVTRVTNTHPPRTVWSQLPLHLALVTGAPLDVIYRLVNLYPGSVSCSDDEKMLPLHLALKHGAHEDVLDLLLETFPDAVKVRGKRNRSTLEYAMNTPIWARALVLTAFLEQNGAGKRRLLFLDNLSKFKESQVEDLHEILVVLDREKDIAETELERVVHELQEIRKQLLDRDAELQEAKLSAELAVVLKKTDQPEDLDDAQRIQLLEEAIKEMQATEFRMVDEETALRNDLDAIKVYVARSCDKHALINLKNHIVALAVRRMQYAQAQTKAEMESLKQTLCYNLKFVEGKSKEEVEAMQLVVNGLNSIKFEEETQEGLLELKNDLAPLKDDLKEKREAGRVRTELQILRRLLAKELVHSDDMETDDLVALTAIIATMKETDLGQAELEDLLIIKKKARRMKLTVLSKTFSRQTERDAIEIHSEVNELRTSAEGDSKIRLESMASSLAKMAMPDIESKINDAKELRREIKFAVKFRRGLMAMREEVKIFEALAKLKRELKLHQMLLASQFEKASGDQKEDLKAMRILVDQLIESTLEFKSSNNLTTLKKQLQNIKFIGKTKNIKDAEIKRKQIYSLIDKQLQQAGEKAVSSIQDSLNFGMLIMQLSEYLTTDVCY